MSAPSMRSFVAALLVAASLGAAAQGFDTPPTAGAPRPLSIAPPTEQRLPNGLRVVLAERRGVQLVTAQLLVLAGAEADPGARAGLASMTANLLTKGTRRHSATQLAQAAESLGGALDSGAGWHQSEVGITVAVPQADAALALVAEVVTEPAFAQAELDRSRAQALDGLKVSYSQPGTLAGLAAQRLLYGNSPYAHPVSGTPVSLSTLARADLVALHAARYRPDNAVLVLAGDLDAATALQLATRHFGSWKPASSAPPPVAVGGQPATSTSPIAIDMPGSGQAAVVVMAALPKAGADRATAIVTNAVLGGGFSSRLNQEIRIRRGLSYGAGSGIDLRPGGGALRATVQTKNESAAEVVTLVQAEFDRLAASLVPDVELGARKANLVGGFSRSVETTSGLAAAVQSLIVAGLPVASLGTRIEALLAVSAADVQRYAAAHLGQAGRRVIAVAGESARFGEALKAAAPGLRVVPAAQISADGGAGVPP